MIEHVMRSLETINRIPENKRTEQLNERIAFGILKLLETNAQYIKYVNTKLLHKVHEIQSVDVMIKDDENIVDYDQRVLM